MREAGISHARRMDHMYRYQRHFYDVTRKYYLFGRDTLIRPEGYRDWVVVSRSSGPHPSGAAYVNPAAYREYQATGAFPEGTVLVWASIDSPVLLASVKDRTRFDEGWGFFDFTEPAGAVAARADVLPESSGCRTCHRRST